MFTLATESQQGNHSSNSLSSTQKEKRSQQRLEAERFNIHQPAQLQKIADTYIDNHRSLLNYQNDQYKLPKQFKTNNTQIDSTQSNEVVQREIDVKLKHNGATKKKLVARGTVEDFEGGSSAGDEGWTGVTKYRSRYSIGEGDDEDSGDSGSLQNEFTNPEAGHVLARQNGGNGGDPENIFAQDGGTNNGIYKSFEIGMRNHLNAHDDDDDVEFVSYLVGDGEDDLEIGSISEYALGDASDISSEEDDSSDEEDDESM